MTGRSVISAAPGKVILFGEHAVVYGYPAIAAPVHDLQASARVTEAAGNSGDIEIDAPDVRLHSDLASLPLDHPLSLAVRGTLTFLKISAPPALTVRISSTLPVAAGLGSGAAVSVAVIRALAAFFDQPLPDEIVSGLAYEVEKKHHGQPSGIDNTVITYAQPIFFQRGKPFEILSPRQALTLIIADTGIASPTGAAVAGVRQRRDANPGEYDALFDEIGRIALRARETLTRGEAAEAGPLMNANHDLLRRLGVSCEPLDRLVGAARDAGALGAKLSGGGLGGNMIALIRPEDTARVSAALLGNGAAHFFSTIIPAEKARQIE